MVSDSLTFNQIQTWIQKPLFLLMAVFAVALILMMKWGLDGLLGGLALMIVLVLLLVFLNRPNPKQQLSEERARLLQELSIAEKKMLHRELSRDLFESIAREKQARLVEIDALFYV